MICRKGRTNWIAALLVLAAWGALAQSVSLELRNGDRISGQILSETNNRIVLSNAWSKEISIPSADISKRTMLATTNALVAGSTNTNAAAKTNGVALAKAVAATNNLFTSPLLKNWHGEIQVGADLTFSERNREIYNGKLKLIYAKDRLKSIFDYDATYGRSEVDETTIKNGKSTTRRVTKTDANRMNGTWKLDYDLTKKIYVYNLAGAGYDEIRKIDVRYEVGPGVGYHLIQWSNFFVNVEAGASYQKEERSDGTELSRFYGRVAENATWKITPRLTWDEKFEYLPSVEDPSQYRMRFETNFRYALLQNVFFNLSLIDTYDSQPANGVTQNDLQLRSSVGVKF
jgi:hypothetical protein